MFTRMQNLIAIIWVYLSEKLSSNSYTSYKVTTVVRESSIHEAILDLFWFGRKRVPHIIISKLLTYVCHNISWDSQPTINKQLSLNLSLYFEVRVGTSPCTMLQLYLLKYSELSNCIFSSSLSPLNSVSILLNSSAS